MDRYDQARGSILGPRKCLLLDKTNYFIHTHIYAFKKKVFGCKDKRLSGWPVQLWKKMHQWHPPPMEGRTLPHN